MEEIRIGIVTAVVLAVVLCCICYLIRRRKIAALQAAVGFVIRDHEGNPFIAGSRSVGNSNVPVAECSALRDGLFHALCRGARRILVEGDSKLIIDLINNQASSPWRIRTLLNDVISFAANFEEISFKYIPREANFVADAMASLGHQVSQPTLWNYKLPLSALNAFNFDRFGTGCCRGFSL